MKSTRAPFSELEPSREIEGALRGEAAIRGVVDHAGASARNKLAGGVELADVIIGIIQIDVVKEVDRLDAELALNPLREPELLEERGVGAPVAGATQTVALLVTERSDRRSAEDAQVVEVKNIPFA